MIKFLIFSCCSLSFASCSQPQANTNGNATSSIQSAVAVNTPTLPKLSKAETLKLGKQIWKNESGGSVMGLTAWNVGEEFPSLGIGHFIWYPKNFKGRFDESFPSFIAYAKQRGRKDIPAWTLTASSCPWNSRQAFLRDRNGQKLSSLRTFLKNSVSLQTEFIIQRSRAALPKILAAAPRAHRARIQANYAKVSQTSNGTYALIDYVNFKGEGTKLDERYNGKGWGLLQVLQEMRETKGGQASAREFAAAAKRVLLRRVKNSPPKRGEKRWTAGWNNRCNTYAKPL